jgi:hypothetical protein
VSNSALFSATYSSQIGRPAIFWNCACCSAGTLMSVMPCFFHFSSFTSSDFFYSLTITLWAGLRRLCSKVLVLLRKPVRVLLVDDGRADGGTHT